MPIDGCALVASVVGGDAADNGVIGGRMATLHVLYFLCTILTGGHPLPKRRPVEVSEASDGQKIRNYARWVLR